MRFQIEHDKKNFVNLDSDDIMNSEVDEPDFKGPSLSGIKRSISMRDTPATPPLNRQ